MPFPPPLLFFPFLLLAQASFSQNPIFRDIYTADPSAHVFNDTLYVYPSHDKADAHWFNMEDWHVFSTTDMQHWTDHGVAFSLKDIPWATQYAWAPDCAFRNGKYYFYYPVDKDYIGVAVSDKPYGPFKDPLGKPLICRETPGVKASRGLIDPCLFMDDNNVPYIIFGQNELNIVRLNEDMISFADTVRQIKGADYFFEAAWMHKHDGKYYLSYSGKPKTSRKAKIRYAVSDNPYGPFTYRGVILDKVNSGTNHASIVEFKGQNYLFYHTSDLFFLNNPKANRHGLIRRMEGLRR